MLKKYLRRASLSLCALVAACQTMQQQTEESIQQSPRQVIQQINASSKKYTVLLTPFSAFDPPATTEFINVDSDVKFYLDEGLDGDKSSGSKEVLKINQYLVFEEMIYHEARMLGYTPEEVQMMPPRQAVKLACDLVARRLNYGGMAHDFTMKTEVEQRLNKLKATLETLRKASSTSEEKKKEIKERLEMVVGLEEKWGEFEEEEIELRRSMGGYLRIQDHMSIDTLFIAKEPAVCRHYAKVMNGVFFVLKNKNKKLTNTYVSSYGNATHLWNQVSTVYYNGDEIKIHISLFDATWFDTGNHIEGGRFLALCGKQCVERTSQESRGKS